MQLYNFDYCFEQITGEPLPYTTLVLILTDDERSRIVYDREGLLGRNTNFGINYGSHGSKKGFIHDNVEYVLDSDRKKISVSPPFRPRVNLFFDADKRDSFKTYKVQFDSIDEVLALFIEEGYDVVRE